MPITAAGRNTVIPHIAVRRIRKKRVPLSYWSIYSTNSIGECGLSDICILEPCFCSFSCYITPTITILKIYNKACTGSEGKLPGLTSQWQLCDPEQTADLSKLSDLCHRLYKVRLLVPTSRLGELDEVIQEEIQATVRVE